ncbi:uroporphyrinogen-III synthase [Methylomonas sp. MgM2]
MNGLNGALVLVTRPAAQAGTLCRLIEQHGGQALCFPTLEIRPASVTMEAITKALAGDWLIFTSANAVEFGLKTLAVELDRLRPMQLAAIGQATAEALRQAGLNVKCMPEQEFSSEGLLAEPIMQNVVGQQITIVRGVGGREKLAQTLRERGAAVDYLEVYRRCCPKTNNDTLIKPLREGKLAASTVTSSEALQNLLALLDRTTASLLRKLPLIVVSNRIGQLAQKLSFEHISVSRQPTDAAILETLTMLFCGENSDRSN